MIMYGCRTDVLDDWGSFLKSTEARMKSASASEEMIRTYLSFLDGMKDMATKILGRVSSSGVFKKFKYATAVDFTINSVNVYCFYDKHESCVTVKDKRDGKILFNFHEYNDFGEALYNVEHYTGFELAKPATLAREIEVLNSLRGKSVDEISLEGNTAYIHIGDYRLELESESKIYLSVSEKQTITKYVRIT